MEASEDEGREDEEEEDVIVMDVDSLVEAVTEAVELVTLVDGIDESVTLSLAELDELEADGLTVVAEAEAEPDREDVEELVVEAEEDARLDDTELELEDADEARDELELELGAAEVVVEALDASRPKTDILYHPPHFWLALPAQLVLHSLSGTMSVEAKVPQKHSFPFCRP